MKKQDTQHHHPQQDEHTEDVVDALEALDRVSEAIKFHNRQPQPDPLAIAQYEQLRRESVSRLQNLLSSYGLQVNFLRAA